MPQDLTDTWRLKKHDSGEIFGPVPFEKILEWARTAQIAPQDMISDDGEVWTKAPMNPALRMDYIVKLDDDHYYGPTTSEALLEFLENGEINAKTVILDCCTSEEKPFGEWDFFPKPEEEPEEVTFRSPGKGLVRLGLQKRIRELEVNLLEKRRQLDMAADTIQRLEARVRELEARLREIAGFGRGE